MATYEREATGSIPGASTSIPEGSREDSSEHAAFRASHEDARKSIYEQIAAWDWAAVGQPDETFTVKVSAADMATLRFLLAFWGKPNDAATIGEYLSIAASYCLGTIGPTLRPDAGSEPEPKKARKARKVRP